MATKCKQLDVGNEAEIKIGKFFQSKGYWAHIFQKKIVGQPVDIIAGKTDKKNEQTYLWLIDAKHLRKEDKSFSFSRIESNQKATLEYAKKFANLKNLGFCICWDIYPEKIFFLHYDKLVELEQKGAKSAKLEELEDFECVLK